MGAKGTKLKVLVDKEQNRVLYAESDKDFVDILFSFLTMPMGTIVRILQMESTPSVIGSMSTLYEGLERLDMQYFETYNHKSQLLHLSNPFQFLCRKLKVNVDDSKPVIHYFCESSCQYGHPKLLTFQPHKKCACGKLMTKQMYVTDDYGVLGASGSNNDGVFLKGPTTFIITDDLKVMPSSTATGLEILNDLGVVSHNMLEEKIMNVGFAQVVSLLRLSILSKTPLTDLIFQNPMGSFTESLIKPQGQIKPITVMNTHNDLDKMTLKLMVKKYENKVLYAEAQDDFVNYLLTLPSITLGSIVKLLDKNPSIGCISNLYKSVEGLSADSYLKSNDLKARLLSPKLGIQAFVGKVDTTCQIGSIIDGDCKTMRIDPNSYIFKNLDSPTIATIGKHRFVKGPATYIVTDDLVVTPLSQVSSISILKSLKVDMSDLEIVVVSFGKKEALRLLEASLTTKSALTWIFNCNSCKGRPKIKTEF